MLRRALAAVAILALSLALLELTLQGLARLAPRLVRVSVAARADGSFRILCVGDSHTYGWAVERSESWPARLEQLLNEGGRTRFEVLNLGVPSSNSSQTVRRLDDYLTRFDPDLLVVTIGGNDVANLAERDADLPGSGSVLADVLWNLRSFRLVVFALQQQRQVRAAREAADVELRMGHPFASMKLKEGDFEVRFNHRMKFDVLLDDESHARLLAGNLRRIVHIARAREVPVVFASYARDLPPHVVANAVMEAAPGALFVSQRFEDVEGELPAPSPGAPAAWFMPDGHPTPPLYLALARNLRAALVRAGLVPDSR